MGKVEENLAAQAAVLSLRDSEPAVRTESGAMPQCAN